MGLPGPTIRRTYEHIVNYRDNTLDVGTNLFIGKMKRSNSLLGELIITGAVCFDTMCIPVDFDSQAFCRAEKIHNEWNDDVLTAKLET